MRTETIAEVGLDEERRVFISPNAGDYEFAYRAGMETCWNHETGAFPIPGHQEAGRQRGGFSRS